ncbi:MAG: porphobilinogen synthase [Candidatus Marinimicrobia bacterium]|nr:porphobilinogen synthase [Candidatus Neomarinimicrobiota bacterium]
MKKRPARLRSTKSLRALNSELTLDTKDLIYPIFIKTGKNIKNEVESMPDIYQFSLDMVFFEIEYLLKHNIDKFILFGITDKKDEFGSDALSDNGIIQNSLKEIKKRFPEILLITDLCMCEYTSHGHCGILNNGRLDNDQTLEYIQRQAVSHANFGADIIAPSGMIDNAVKHIRLALDSNNHKNIPIMSYSAKFASNFYGPFRYAAESTPQHGDRKSYQMSYENRKEAIKEVQLDIEEGADIVMVKPALSFLDIIRDVKNTVNIPVAAYNVSGEYSMVKAASKLNWIDEDKVRHEILTSIKRAGADMIITYFAKSFAESLK